MKNFLFWLIAFMITVSAAIWQRKTGPTNPVRTSVEISGKSYNITLKRSQTNTHDCRIELSLPPSVQGELHYKRYPSDDDWYITPMNQASDMLTGELPSQPAAGKLQYYIVLRDGTGSVIPVMREKPVIIRFKGDVPALIMIPHILIMFIAMLLSNLAGLFALFGDMRHKQYGALTFLLLIAGGMILGPVVQYYAFGEFWTGIPFGWDMTDNKTLFAVFFWILAVALNRQKNRPVWTTIAALVLLLVYSIPHSLFGSQLDYSSGDITQGVITFFLML